MIEFGAEAFGRMGELAHPGPIKPYLYLWCGARAWVGQILSVLNLIYHVAFIIAVRMRDEHREVIV